MIGLLIVAHGSLGESLIACASHMLGQAPVQCTAISVSRRSDHHKITPIIQQSLDALNTGDGVLILTDIYGATPSNIVTNFLLNGEVEAVAGVSLPMLLRTINYQQLTLKELINKALSGAVDGAVYFNKEKCFNKSES